MLQFRVIFRRKNIIASFVEELKSEHASIPLQIMPNYADLEAFQNTNIIAKDKNF